MSQQYDSASVYNFLAHTPEGGLRKMLVDPKGFSEAHFVLMMKIIRACNESQFCEHFGKSDFPKIKMGPNDMKLKDKFWNELINVLKVRGLLSPAQKSA